jgi:hypothetical protein
MKNLHAKLLIDMHASRQKLRHADEKKNDRHACKYTE